MSAIYNAGTCGMVSEEDFMSLLHKHAHKSFDDYFDSSNRSQRYLNSSIRSPGWSLRSSLRDVNKSAYMPRTITFGFCYEANHLNEAKDIYQEIIIKEFERLKEYKVIYSSHLLLRTFPSGVVDLFVRTPTDHLTKTIHMCTNKMLELLDKTNYCYRILEVKFEPGYIAREMVLDGCFILELLMRWSTRSKDSIIQSRSLLNNIIRDLLLLENQIPFFVLRELFQLTLQQIPQDGGILNSPSSLPLEQLILNFFFNDRNSHFKSIKIPSGLSEGSYIGTILGLVHSYYLPRSSSSISELGDYIVTRYTATEIFRSGIKLKPCKIEKVLLDVRFRTPCLFSWFPIIITSIFLFPWRFAIFIYKTIFYTSPPSASRLFMPNREECKMKSARASCCWLSFICQMFGRATLEIPELCITDSTESFLRNLIAYEQSSTEIPNYITSYAFLMDAIINTKEDIETLEKSGVLKNYLGSSQDAADLFNSLCIGVVFSDDDFYFFDQCKQVDAYCELYWANLLGSFKVTYFSNRWTGISVFAALVLFAFTGLQTVCSVIQTWYS